MGQIIKGLNLEGSSYLPESLDDMQHLKWGLSRIVELNSLEIKTRKANIRC